MNRKAESESHGGYSLWWLIRNFVYITYMVILFLLIALYVKTDVNTMSMESELLFAEAMTSPNGYAITDPDTGRTYPYLVDETSLAAKKSFENSLIGAKIDIEGTGTIMLNKALYDKLQPLESLKLEGAPDSYTTEHVIRIKKKDGSIVAAKATMYALRGKQR
ncbi:hypothetical protein HY642_01760 [Candidatus Woesearchaeota archaeon]|nr:hypothetical protein [Candidatus Woesearchaeota archaeon]